jgi:predicted transcriptional regulator
METKTAADIMIPLGKYPHIPYWFNLRQAIAEIEKSEIEIDGRKSLPRVILVFDKQYRLMGLVRRRDILRGLEPEFMGSNSQSYKSETFDISIDPNLAELSPARWISEIRKKADKLVSEIMISIEATVDQDDNLIKIIYKMIKNDLSIIPVMQKNKVIGVVRSVDVFHEVSKIIL